LKKQYALIHAWYPRYEHLENPRYYKFVFNFNHILHYQDACFRNVYLILIFSILFSIFCALLVGICLIATIVEILGGGSKASNLEKEIVENGGHILMDKEVSETTPLLPDITTKVIKNEGK
jgi:cellulose synthase/poly-beta-1,6-N-acetylglucosamine synthase-like glycosyltransferase